MCMICLGPMHCIGAAYTKAFRRSHAKAKDTSMVHRCPSFTIRYKNKGTGNQSSLGLSKPQPVLDREESKPVKVPIEEGLPSASPGSAEPSFDASEPSPATSKPSLSPTTPATQSPSADKATAGSDDPVSRSLSFASADTGSPAIVQKTLPRRLLARIESYICCVYVRNPKA